VTKERKELEMERMARTVFLDSCTQSVLTGWVDYFDITHFEANMKLIKR